VPLDTALIGHVHRSLPAARLIAVTIASRSAAALTDTTGQLPPRRPYLLITVVDPTSVCIGTKVAATSGQTRQFLMQLTARLLALGTACTGGVIGHLLLLPTGLVESFGTRLPLASRVVTLDDLRSYLDLLGTGARLRAEMYISLGIYPAVNTSRSPRRDQQGCEQYGCDTHGFLPVQSR